MTGPGRFLEDFEVGAGYRHPLGRTISEADNTWFTLLTMNTHQSHVNAHYAQGTKSRSRPEVGIVSTYTRAVNQDGDECLSFRRSVMVNRRSSTTAGADFPEPRNGPLTLAALDGSR